jgi:hypothetical protein
MKNIFLSVVVVATLVAAGVGGTFAGFVDTETSQGNFVEAGITDLLVNNENDPVGATLQYTHAAPCKSVDFYVDIYNWGVCQGGDLYMHYKNVVSTEDGVKNHLGIDYVYDGVSSVGNDIPDGYREAVGSEPAGPGVWSSEPEKIAEVGGGWICDTWIPEDDVRCLGEDYASGIAAHLGILTEVCDDGLDGILDDADDDGNGEISVAEYAAHDWVAIQSLTGHLEDIECNKNWLGFLQTQHRTWVHIVTHVEQIEDLTWTGCSEGEYWLANALQGDKATWDMMWELVADP